MKVVLHWAGGLLALLLAVWYFPVVSMMVLPGLLVGFHPLAAKLRFLPLLTLIVVTSLATHVAVFSLLKFVPLSFSAVVQALLVTSGVLVVWLNLKRPFQLNFQVSDIWDVVFILPLFLLFWSWFPLQLVPAGADMSTHSYIAKTISYYDAFPKTYYPIVPIEQFGFESAGMPSLMALVQLFGKIPMHSIALGSSLLLVPLCGLVFFIWLRLFFSPLVSAITMYALFFVNYNFIVMLGYGALPTVMGILFLVAAFYICVLLFKQRQFTFLNAVWLSTLLAASTLSHLIPIVAGAYFVSVILLTVCIKETSEQRKRIILFEVNVLALVVILCSGFLTSIQPLSQDTYEYLKDWQRNQSQLSSITEPIPIKFWVLFAKQSGENWLLLLSIGVLVSIASQRSETKWFLSCLLVYFILLLNVEYWVLPFSPALYPNRFTAVGDFFFIYFVAIGFESIQTLIKNFWKEKDSVSNKSMKGLSLVLILIFVTYSLFTVMKDRYHVLKTNYQDQALVTIDDLNVINWIAQNTQETDVIANNYGDASIWIPALAGRRVIQNDASPQSFDALGQGIATLKPTYAFIGSKALYTDHVYVTASIAAERGYKLATQSGQTQLYTIPTP